MPKQPALPGLHDATKKKVTRRCQATPTFTSYGDTHFSEVSRNAAALARADRQESECPPGPRAVGRCGNGSTLEGVFEVAEAVAASLDVEEMGAVHSFDTTTAKVYDRQVWDEFLHGEEASVWAEKGNVSAEREVTFTKQEKFWGVMRKAPKGSPLHPVDAQINRIIAMVGAGESHMESPRRSCLRNRRSQPTNDTREPVSFAVRSCLRGSEIQMRLP